MCLRDEEPSLGLRWISVSQAAERLGVSPVRVYRLVLGCKLRAREVDRVWLILARSVEARVALLRSEGGA